MRNKSNKKEKYFSAAEKGSFAEFTVEKRFKKIFEDYCSGNYEKFIETPMLEIFFGDKVFSSNEKGKSIDAIAITIEHFNEIKNDDEISNKEKYKFFFRYSKCFLEFL
ncbi:hypothetical protein [uncultured Treponema sp.]|uniref:hypothetical protein n=1 Tax=uncultured Treponema sp. TaxID=162155 RepID=UPI002585AAEA|nr:hypothetical protein [uncultured Treponema sp.]